MFVDISFDNAKVYNIEKADIVKGQKFTLTTDFENGRFFSDNDPVLSYKVDGTEVNATADEVGLATIQIQDQSFAIVKILTINVVDSIVGKAATLGAVAGVPVPK